MMRIGGADVDAEIPTPLVGGVDLGQLGAQFFARMDDLSRVLARAACAGGLDAPPDRVDALLDPALQAQRAGEPISVERRGAGVACPKYLPPGYVSSSMCASRQQQQ